jgi:membrane peptidoglycan carboxypeptidase
VSNPDVPGPHWQEPAANGGEYGGAGYGAAAGYGGAGGRSADRGGASRSGGSYTGSHGRRARSAPADYQGRGSEPSRANGRSGPSGPPPGARSAGPGGAGRAPAASWNDDPRDRARAAASRSGGPGRPDGGYAGGGYPGDRGPQGPRGRGYAPGQNGGPSQNGVRSQNGRRGGGVADDLRERLGVNGNRGGDPVAPGRRGGSRANGSWESEGPRGRSAVGYADDRRPRERSRQGGTSWDREEPGSTGRGRRSGGGNGGRRGGRDGGDRPRRGRRSFAEWFKSGDWWRRWTWKKVFGLLGACCLLVILAVAGAFLYAYESIPIPTDVNASVFSQPSTVYFANHKEVAQFTDEGVSHVILTTSQIPKDMDQAITAAEDRSFYTEGGISITGLMRAFYDDLRGGSYLQGGSTLTEQFVKNYYAGFSGADNTDKTLSDKLKQVIVAIKLAHTESKSWILTNYLNTVSFGDNANGVGAAAKAYFDEPAQKLTIPQAAMLASLVNAPGVFDPDPNAGEAYTALVARWQYTLYNMYRDGNISMSYFESVTGCNADPVTTKCTGKAEFPKVHFTSAAAWTGTNYYVMNMVEQELTSTYKLSSTQLANGGYKIYTTIRPSLMRGLAAAIAKNKQLMAQGGVPLPWYAHIAASLVQPGTGDILAFYAGSGYQASTKRQEKYCARVKCEFNFAEAPEPVGSSMKPYVLATAVKQGMDVQNSILNGFSPLYIPPDWPQDRDVLSSRVPPADLYGYTHFNEPSENTGPTGVAEATAISSDPAFMDLAHKVGDQNIMEMAKSLGVGQNPLNSDGINDFQGLEQLYGTHGSVAGSLQIALGRGPLTPIEQSTTFATLVDDGHYATGHIVAKIVRTNGTVVPSQVKYSDPLSTSQAADVDYALSFDNQDRFPGATAWPNAAWNRPVVAKTGTLGNGQFASEAWFNGAIPQYSLSVDLFTNTQAQNIDGLGGISGGLGGTWPAKIWDTFMTDEFNNLPTVQLPTPDYVGYTKWNQVGFIPKTKKKATKSKKPNPSPSTSPTCHPYPGHSCQPGGSTSPTPTPTVSSSSPTTGSPSPSCSFAFGHCTSTGPPASAGVAAAFEQQPADRHSHVSLLGRAVAVFLATLF